MYVLTLWPEWAHAITHLGKRVENRGWKRDSMIGEDLAIHAGAKIGGHRGVSEGLLEVEWMAPATERFRSVLREADIVTSAIVAVVRVKDIVQDPGLPWAAAGQWNWVLDNVRVLKKPIPCSGKQGIWKIEGVLLEQVEDQI